MLCFQPDYVSLLSHYQYNHDNQQTHHDYVLQMKPAARQNANGAKRAQSPQRDLFESIVNYFLHDDGYDITRDENDWQRKAPIHWTSCEVIDWIYYTAAERSSFTNDTSATAETVQYSLDVLKVRGENWQTIDGRTMCSMSVSDFVERDCLYGQLFHDILHQRPVDEPYWWRTYSSITSDTIDFNLVHDPPMCNSGCLPSIYSLFPVPHLAEINDYDDITNESCFPIDGRFSPQAEFDCQSSGSTSTQSLRPALPTADDATWSEHSIESVDELPSLARCIADNNVGTTENNDDPVAKRRKDWLKVRRVGGRRSRVSSNGRSSLTSVSSSGDSGEETVETQKGPKKRKTKVNAVHLWQFMLALLDDNRYNPELIKWLNREEGVFRIVQSAETARLWGIKKKNRTMTFEKMSRSLRWCRENGFLASVPKDKHYPKKLCFRFGALAQDWNGLSMKPIGEVVGISGLKPEETWACSSTETLVDDMVSNHS